jgi:hypothetical protein
MAKNENVLQPVCGICSRNIKKGHLCGGCDKKLEKERKQVQEAARQQRKQERGQY